MLLEDIFIGMLIFTWKATSYPFSIELDKRAWFRK